MTAEELLRTIYRFYPRGLDADHARYYDSEEHLRLVAARKAAGANAGPWLALLDRLQTQSPECVVTDRSIHLPTGRYDACYFGEIELPWERPGAERTAPLDAGLARRLRKLGVSVPDPKIPKAELVFMVSFILPHHVIYADGPDPTRFTFAPEEQRYADAIAREFAETYRSTPMDPAVGQLIIPDLTMDGRPFQTVTIFDAVFSDHPRWIRLLSR
jgi:hypothetical protein